MHSVLWRAGVLVLEGIGYLELASAILWMLIFLGAGYFGNMGGQAFTKEFVILLVTSQTFLREDQLTWLLVGGNLTLPLGAWWASWRMKYLFKQVPAKLVNCLAYGATSGAMYHFGTLFCRLFIEDDGWRYLVKESLTTMAE